MSNYRGLSHIVVVVYRIAMMYQGEIESMHERHESTIGDLKHSDDDIT